MEFDSKQTEDRLTVGGSSYSFYSLRKAEQCGLQGVSRLPYTLKIVLENLIRQHSEGSASSDGVVAVVDWLKNRSSDREIGLKPTRVLMPDSSGIPFLGDMAAMRDAMKRLKGDPKRINPSVLVDFIVDHSVIVDWHGSADALAHNMDLEFSQNKERYEFLRWASQAYDNLRVIPPGSGICHQINLEFLAQVVWKRKKGQRILIYPDSLIGMDSHTAMINSLGIIGWGVGGLEGGIAALGEPISMLLPQVVGCRLSGKLRPGVTSTDLVLTITQLMRSHKMVGKFIEYCGPGVDELSLPDRATVANMTPEYGATMSFFPVDAETLRFLRSTNRDPQHIELVEAYCRIQGLWRDGSTPLPDYSQAIELDLASIEPSVSGPRRPHERVLLHEAPKAFKVAYTANCNATPPIRDDAQLTNGTVVIAAITSCTNTSNPSVMIGAGLLARNAVQHGLRTKPWVKTSLSPGSRVVAAYLERSGLQKSLDRLGFNVTGFGCMSCMGNSGPLAPSVSEAIDDKDLVTVAVLSGNRNFEGRIHTSVQSNFLASPPLVVAYALAGSILTDIVNEPLGHDEKGAPVYLRDIWPTDEEIREVMNQTLTREMYGSNYRGIADGTPDWQQLKSSTGPTFRWNAESTFIRRPPFFDQITATPPIVQDIRGARVLAIFGDMLTTDHISPIGTIPAKTSAGQYLQSLGVSPKDFVSYAARRLNHDVMTRGTFANIRIRNEMTPGVEGGVTKHMPGGEIMSMFDAAERYRADSVPLIVVAGSDYGAGSSRDWAAKGTSLLGVRAVLAESFERIHRSNLIGMGIVPLQLPAGITRKSLKLDGSEVFDFIGLGTYLTPRMEVTCIITHARGERETLGVLVRLDTTLEVEYLQHGGILNYVLRRRLLN